ncbi:MAG TPA: DUF805 domain-containing protein [Candidatus Limnocylindrales bacterium]|nr:DUF805 domain-containing protein [Candidatus Limnocylindrales bacterium]
MKSIFKGRIGRGLFFVSIILLGTFLQIISTSALALRKNNHSEPNYTELIILHILILLVVVTFQISVFAKRFHDIGKSGYWGILGLIPLIQWAVFVYLVFKKGGEMENKYGKEPQGLIF